jgi:hypothetical protein
MKNYKTALIMNHYKVNNNIENVIGFIRHRIIMNFLDNTVNNIIGRNIWPPVLIRTEKTHNLFSYNDLEQYRNNL